MKVVHKRYQMRTQKMYKEYIFRAFFLREASRNEDCNAVPELENHNLYLFFQAVQIKNQTVR